MRRIWSAGSGHPRIVTPRSAAQVSWETMVGSVDDSRRPAETRDATVAPLLEWADEAASRADFVDALTWLRSLENSGHQLPDGYAAKRQRWRRATAGRSGGRVYAGW
jgi:hypothetical protein